MSLKGSKEYSPGQSPGYEYPTTPSPERAKGHSSLAPFQGLSFGTIFPQDFVLGWTLRSLSGLQIPTAVANG